MFSDTKISFCSVVGRWSRVRQNEFEKHCLVLLQQVCINSGVKLCLLHAFHNWIWSRAT